MCKDLILKRSKLPPEWFNWYYEGMVLEKVEAGKSLVLGNKVASLQVDKVGGGMCQLNWQIVLDSGLVQGKLMLVETTVKEIFGLLSQRGPAWMRERYGNEVYGLQGVYIRYDDYLNIPGPGTGHGGDPNISIYLTDEIKEAVRKLLE